MRCSQSDGHVGRTHTPVGLVPLAIACRVSCLQLHYSAAARCGLATLTDCVMKPQTVDDKRSFDVHDTFHYWQASSVMQRRVSLLMALLLSVPAVRSLLVRLLKQQPESATSKGSSRTYVALIS